MAPDGVGTRPRLVLASSSPRRRELLASAGLIFEVRPVDVDETPTLGEGPSQLVARLARAKASAGVRPAPERSRDEVGSGSGSTPAEVVLAADTVVAVDGEVFGKPTSASEARTMLSRLSGRSHDVFTGVAMAGDGDRVEVVVERTEVRFRTLDAAEIDCYVASGEPMDKAGAYGIQGRAGLFVERVDGSYHNVVGLPLHALEQLCWAVGVPLMTWVDCRP